MAYFYSHLIRIDSILIKLDELSLGDQHKNHLASLIDATVHQTVLDIIFSKLSEEDKEVFIEKLKEDPQDRKLLEFLNLKIENLEEEITQIVEKLKEELHQDIEEARRR